MWRMGLHGCGVGGRAGTHRGRPVRQPGHVGAYGKHFNGHKGYFDFVLTRPTGTAEPGESTVGRVNLERLKQWCENCKPTFKM